MYVYQELDRHVDGKIEKQLFVMAHAFSMHEQEHDNQIVTVIQYDAPVQDGTYYCIVSNRIQEIIRREDGDSWKMLTSPEGGEVAVNMNQVTHVMPVSDERIKSDGLPPQSKSLLLSAGGNAMLTVSDTYDMLGMLFKRTLIRVN